MSAKNGEAAPLRDWFAVEKIDGDTFAVSEYGHWEETHCYLMCGSEKALLIDTGLGVADIRRVVESLTELPVEAAVTHAHWDHIGGLGLFENTSAHAAEKTWLSAGFPIPLSAVKDNLLRAPCKFPEGFDIDNYKIYRGEPRRILHDGDRFDLGNRQIVAVHTPGHSPGHCCFYEPVRGYLCSGDLIYEGCLDAFYPSTDPRLFWQSVKRIQSLRISRILPGHHRLSVPVDIVGEIEKAFRALSEAGKLKRGGGVFDCGSFQIHI